MELLKLFLFVYWISLGYSFTINDYISSKFKSAEITKDSLNYEIDALTIGWTSKSKGAGEDAKIIRVTNLNTTGDGSFINAILAEGPRIVVFEVSGVINLKGRSVKIESPYLTIAGQTAPDKGITLINGGLRIATHDVLVQHIHIRPGDSGEGKSLDGLSTMGGAYDVIVDHCSFSWAIDENLSASGPRFEGATPDEWRKNTSHRITFSNNIIGEGLDQSKHTKGVAHSMGMLIHDNVTEVLIIGNLFYSNSRRNPIFKGGATGAIVNNYIYNPGKMSMAYRLSYSEWEGKEIQMGSISVIGNILQQGKNSEDKPLFEHIEGKCKLFFADNQAHDINNSKIDIFRGDSSNLVSTMPIWNDNISPLPLEIVKEYIIKNVGANPERRDMVDSRIIENVILGKGEIINSEIYVGGYPSIKSLHSDFRVDQWDLKKIKRLENN